MRVFKPTEKHIATLQLIAKRYNQQTIAQALHESKMTTSKRVNRLIIEGFVILENRSTSKILILSAKGLEILVGSSDRFTSTIPNPLDISTSRREKPASERPCTSTIHSNPQAPSPPASPTPQPVQPQPSPPAQATKRLHALGLKYPLLNPVDSPTKLFQESREVVFHSIDLNNNDQVVVKHQITTKTTTQHLILYAPTLYFSRNVPSIITEAQAKAMLDRIALDYEARLRVKLKRIKKNVLESEVMQEEIADERHPLAEATPDDISRIVLARAKDGKERLIADTSKGFKELETVHAKTAGEDSDKVDEQFSGILDGKIDLRDVPKLKGFFEQITETIGQMAKLQMGFFEGQREATKFFTTHNALMDELVKRETLAYERELREELKQNPHNRWVLKELEGLKQKKISWWVV